MENGDVIENLGAVEELQLKYSLILKREKNKRKGKWQKKQNKNFQ